MSPQEYQSLAARTECDQEAASKRRHYADVESSNPLLATRLVHAALGVAGEAGELAYAVEKWLQYGKPLDPVNIVEEIGDILWYVALACNALNVSLEDVMVKNIAKLRARYPEKYSDSRAAEEGRDRNVERAVLEAACPRGGCEDVQPMSVANHGVPLSNDYDRYCRTCNIVPVHKTNTLGVCPDCYALGKR